MGKFLEEFLSYLSGAVYGIALWLWIDATAYSGAYPDVVSSSVVSASSIVETSHYVHVRFAHWIPFIISSIAVFFVNLGSHEGLVGGMAEDESYVNRVRIVTAIALFVLFGAMLGGCIWAGSALLGSEVINKWPGVSMIVTNILVVVSALIYRFKRFAEKDD